VTESVLAELNPLIQEKGHQLSFVRAGIVIDELARRRTLSGEFFGYHLLPKSAKLALVRPVRARITAA
jgi:hypothetical protein